MLTDSTNVQCDQIKMLLEENSALRKLVAELKMQLSNVVVEKAGGEQMKPPSPPPAPKQVVDKTMVKEPMEAEDNRSWTQVERKRKRRRAPVSNTKAAPKRRRAPPNEQAEAQTKEQAKPSRQPANARTSQKDEKTANIEILETLAAKQFGVKKLSDLVGVTFRTNRRNIPVGKPLRIIANDGGLYAEFKKLVCDIDSEGVSGKKYYVRNRVRGDRTFVYEQLKPAKNRAPPPGPFSCDMQRIGGYGQMYRKDHIYINLLHIYPDFGPTTQQVKNQFIGSRSWAGFQAQKARCMRYLKRKN